ncbi:MAG: BrnT family toxin [Gallionellaceae bacterium]|nr:MAG: BrnT family toxin [Gallionellaceae bacterium]
MKFEWGEEKATLNLSKHGVAFEEATTVFSDDLSLTGNDPDHSRGEHRLITFGVSFAGRLLAVSHTERSGKIRIISARLATRAERKLTEVAKDEMRPEYRREDFGKMVRGKYAKKCKAASNVVVLEPAVAKAFPNGAAVNEALLGLLNIAKSAGLTQRVSTKRKAG